MHTYHLLTASNIVLPQPETSTVQAVVILATDGTVVAQGDLTTMLVAYPEVPITDLGESTVIVGQDNLLERLAQAQATTARGVDAADGEQEHSHS